MHSRAGCGPFVARTQGETKSMIKMGLDVMPLTWGFGLERAKGIEPS